jgi:FAD/FMN-containing dehydrogenase
MEALDAARAMEVTAAFEGGGNSYGDAFQNAEGVVIDLSRMDRVLKWDPNSGVIVCEPGVTIRRLWQHTIGDRWWPPVVSGTSNTTLGGALSANIHGKNNFHAGPIGEHVRQFDLLLPSGETRNCSPTENSDIFFAAIGGFGLLGAIVSIELQMKRINSGLVEVEARSVANWEDAFRAFESFEARDYVVGWIDCTKCGNGAGRGLLHAANYVEGDPHPEESLSVKSQEIPDTALGWFPRSKMYSVMRKFNTTRRMAFVNTLKFRSGRRESGKVYKTPLAEFNFLLDSAPNWKWAYKPGGLIQYQPFVPKASAQEIFDKITRLARVRKHPAYLGVMKRHRPDRFLLSHAVDGYSLALDFPVTRRNKDSLWDLCHEMDDLVVAAGGRFYFAKDATLSSQTASAFLGDAIGKFLEIKRQLDPECLLQSNLSRRIFGSLAAIDEAKKPPPVPHDIMAPFWAKGPNQQM